MSLHDVPFHDVPFLSSSCKDCSDVASALLPCKTEVQRERRYLKMLVIDVDPFFEVSLSLMSSFADVVMTVVVVIVLMC